MNDVRLAVSYQPWVRITTMPSKSQLAVPDLGDHPPRANNFLLRRTLLVCAAWALGREPLLYMP